MVERFKDKHPKTNGRDGAVKHIFSTTLWPKGNETAEICQNPAEPCVSSSAPAVGMVWGPAPGWGRTGARVTQLGPVLWQMSSVSTSNLGGGTCHGGFSSHGMVNTAKWDNIHEDKPGGQGEKAILENKRGEGDRRRQEREYDEPHL